MELWLPAETIQVTTTHYTDGTSAHTVSGQFHKREIDPPRLTGFGSDVRVTSRQDRVMDTVRPEPRA